MVCPHLRLSETDFSFAGVQSERRMSCLACLFHSSRWERGGKRRRGKAPQLQPLPYLTSFCVAHQNSLISVKHPRLYSPHLRVQTTNFQIGMTVFFGSTSLCKFTSSLWLGVIHGY